MIHPMGTTISTKSNASITATTTPPTAMPALMPARWKPRHQTGRNTAVNAPRLRSPIATQTRDGAIIPLREAIQSTNPSINPKESVNFLHSWGSSRMRERKV